MLNQDQQKGKEFIIRWWSSPKRFMVLEGEAGTGKTFLLKDTIASLTNCEPLYTAPTNEACRQLELALPEDSLIRTTYSALGFNMDTNGEFKELKQGRVSNVLNEVNLLIVDEASMCGELLLEAIKKTDIKVLFLGHRYQLPDVNVNLKPDDLCTSIVFEQDYPLFTLTVNERASGKLYQFITKLPELIYKHPRLLASSYNISEASVINYIKSEAGKQSFLIEESKLICYSNKEVDEWNVFIRQCIFGKNVAQVVPRDKLILTKPTVYVGRLDKVSKGAIMRMKNCDDKITLSTNAKVVVKHVKFAVVLGVDCHELDVEYKDYRLSLYVPLDKDHFENFKKGLKYEIFSLKTTISREKGWNNYHYILSLFTECKYSYALTTHRAQGMTIDSVYVNWKNMKDCCANIYLRYKLLYVACSRAKSNLSIIG